MGLARPVAEHHSSVDVQGPAAIALGEFREHMRWLEQVPVLEYDEDPAAERTSSAFVEAAPLARSVGVAQAAQRDQVREVAACHLLCNVEPVGACSTTTTKSMWTTFGTGSRNLESTDAMTRMDLRGLEGYFDRAVIDLQKQAVALGGRMDEQQIEKFCENVRKLPHRQAAAE